MDPAIPKRRYAWAIVVSFISLGFFMFWVCRPLLHAKFTHGYARMGQVPMPNEFMSARYGWDWVILFLGAFNYTYIVLLPMSLLMRNIGEIGEVHGFFARIMLVPNAISFAALLVIMWIFSCNGGRYQWASSLNYCGINPGNAWCPNTGLFTPDVSTQACVISDELWTAWWSTIVFIMLCWIHGLVNASLTRFQVFK